MPRPIKFKEANVTFAENQEEYLPLPAFKEPRYDLDPYGQVFSCWYLGFWERIMVLFTGKIWVRQLTFWQALQPQQIEVKCPLITRTYIGDTKDEP